MEQALQKLDDDYRRRAGGKRPGSLNGGSDTNDNVENMKHLESALLNLLNTLRQLQQEKQTRQSSTFGDGETKDADDVSATWLVKLCSTIPHELGASHLARSVWDASRLDGDNARQAALVDALGFSDEAMNVMFEVGSKLDEIRKKISLLDLEEDNSNYHSTSASAQSFDVASAAAVPDIVDPEERKRQMLRQEALDAAQVAAITKAEADAMTGGGSGVAAVTHTVTRASDVKARKTADKAAKRAAQALKKAKEAGAIVDETELMAIDNSALGVGGLMNHTQEDLWALQDALLPEGSRQLTEKQRLPKGTTREYEHNLEKVIIPPAMPDKSKLHKRLYIDEIMDYDCAEAFQGTTSLNPMQSKVFDTAFNTQNNLMVCAPTGAGKTNVAMLTVVAHLKNVGLIGYEYDDEEAAGEAGKKIVYIAPMKALAQEVVEKFSSKLKPLGMIVRELTGDTQLTRAEAESANVIVTTPEKWDVVTRKSGTVENSLGNQCGLLIIDEVHLLADERGAVIESIVARTHRLVESRQRQVRIVALSATLPNYEDVAEFLQVPQKGIFFFGPEYRPVPLKQTFIGVNVKTKDRGVRDNAMNDACYDVIVDSLRRGHQCMIFVHSRKGTGDTATQMAERAQHAGVLETLFVTKGKDNEANSNVNTKGNTNRGAMHKKYADKVKKSRNREVGLHFENGMGIHHAGMLRGDRKLTEQMFTDGAIKVLVCTATLAWGVNLPSFTVVIKGTEVYNPEKGGNVDLSILDVQQIFGRAGRPQFDKNGEATLITNQEALKRYLDKLVLPVPIESNFTKQLADHLNAEVVGGTVTNIKEAAAWLKYSYLYVRMLRNPLAYGINADKKADDPMLHGQCEELVIEAAKLLSDYQMLRYNRDSGNLSVAERGRVAAHFYLQAESVANFDDILGRKVSPTDADLLFVVCAATEFNNMQVRQEELGELDKLAKNVCPLKKIQSSSSSCFDDQQAGILEVVKKLKQQNRAKKDKNKDKDNDNSKGRGRGRNNNGNNASDNAEGGDVFEAADKCFILMQAYIARAKIKSFTLISDTNYVASNASRVARAIFELCIKEGKAGPALKLLRLAKSVDNRIWWFQTPLRQFEDEFDTRIYTAIETRRGVAVYDSLQSALDLLDMGPDEVGQMCRSFKEGSKIQRYVKMLPKVEITCRVQPITRSVLRFQIQLDPDFKWMPRFHGGAQSFWLWIEDGDNNKVYHYEYITFTKRTHPEPISLDPAIPAFDPLPKQYYLRLVSDSWVGVEILYPISLNNIKMPDLKTPYTDLLDLTPLPTSALGVPQYEQLYNQKFETLNPIQTQLFHVLYHTDCPVFLGAPTGSGKTLVAELAILRMKRLHANGVCVYIAPLKSLARERLSEWRKRLGSAPLHWKVLELSGDTHHGQQELEKADVLVCTPEKWDLISRGWRGGFGSDGNSSTRAFVKRVRLLVIDEIHLLGEERGAVLEAIVSRTRYISQHLKQAEPETESRYDLTRIVGLSTALANPNDLADWIGIQTTGYGPNVGRGLYNFRPSVRPVPTEVHVQGYPGRHYCPRMATMNKPCYAAIKDYSPTKPVLIFVASRRQTRLTAFDLISYAASDENPKKFLGCSEDKIESVAEQIRDEALRHTITFGIGLHHAGLSSSDRGIVEKMYLNGDIRVLVATATLAWGLNTPSHLVIVKGTEYFDGKTSRYVDYPLTDVLQMIGRAGRPGFDTEGIAVVMVAEDKKNFYKKFLYSPFPVESHQLDKLCENLCAEIAIGTVNSSIDAVGYLMWTFFSRRVKANPWYYGAESGSDEHVQQFLASEIKATVEKLRDAGCVDTEDAGEQETLLSATVLGTASAKFYLCYQTPKQMQVGVREARRIVSSLLSQNSEEEVKDDRQHQKNSNGNIEMIPFHRSSRVDEVATAWLLYTLSSTHEFDELPVRHNEEYLNEELSDNLMWGPDTQQLLAAGTDDRVYHDFDIYSDPHTKCFLLLQAYLEKAELPISDYVNDTSTVVENIPRLLAAMEFVAMDDMNTVGTFDLICQFSRLRQLFYTKSLVQTDPLLQLPGLDANSVQRLKRGKNDGITSITALRSLPRKDANTLLRRLIRGRKIDDMLDSLYAIPVVAIIDFEVSHYVDKQSGRSRGKLKLTLDVDCDGSNKKRNNRSSDDKLDTQPVTIAIVLGSASGRNLLAHKAVPCPRRRNTLKHELVFDWDTANADAGEGRGSLMLRLFLEEIRGFDYEVNVPLK